MATAFAPGAVVTDVARQADVSSTLLYRWRRDLRAGAGGFAEMVAAPTAARGSGATGATIEIEFVGAAHMRIYHATAWNNWGLVYDYGWRRSAVAQVGCF